MDNNTNLNEVSRISAGTVFKGEITALGDIRVDGKFEGRLTSKGRLVVGENAILNGDVISQNVDFSGKMEEGTIYAADTLSLKSGCAVAGDLRYKRLQVELDACINGSLRAMKDNEFDKVAGNQPAKSEKSDDTGKKE